MLALLLVADLASAAAATWPHLTPDEAQRHARHAELASDEEGRVSPELLLAVAAAETSFRTDASTDTVACKRGKCSLFCGVGQTDAKNSKARCRAMRRLDIGYKALARELAWWLRDQRGDLVHAVAGHGCGYSDLKRHKTSARCGEKKRTKHRPYKPPYPDRVADGLRRLEARAR